MREIKFERTVWAERQLAKLCPNNDIKKLGDVLTSEDFDEQMKAIEDMIIIMNEAHERKAHFLDNSYQMNVVTREELECMTEVELMELSNKAFSDYMEDGKTEIDTEPKKRNAEATKSM
jgi:hypothetical protein